MKLEDYLGETNLYDKKERLEINKPKSWLKSVSAFANGKGGKLIFGIKDDNTIVGLTDFHKNSEDISEAIKTKMDSIPEFDMEIKEIDEKVILILTIFPGQNTPYFVIDSGSRIAYKRVGNQSVPATRIDLLNMSLKGKHINFDSLESDKKLQDVTFKDLAIEYKKRTLKDFEEKDLVSFGLVNKKGNLTIAGSLFADGYQVYQSRVFCTRWNGLTKTNGLMEALDDKEFEGNILYLLNVTLDFVRLNTKKMWKKGPIYRIEYPEYPERAVQEALVNALIHRDYSIIGSEIHLDIYDDRMEIYSPGGMYDGSFVQNTNPYNISSSRRNPILADLFSRMDLMERRGSGLRKIIEAYEFEENYTESLKPEFRSTENAFFTILKNLNYGNDTLKDKNDTLRNKNDTQNNDKKLKPKDRQEKIINIIKDNNRITAIELSKKLNVSKRTIERDLSILTYKDILEYIGNSKFGYWKIK